ncbi:glycosyltransferase family 2 protein [Hymenobacter taeanensis]|uniref:Glycosyltransferase family 2 protein n=1 Tax=Hymenobacter taeanensis TaxID=2735321 RepID=A0A6M6BKG8_9BACT|nr:MULTISPECIES: glycosyltransferase family 2 protein [Hymenobacter]QJX47555.1 glycosyltransferase family 2 protein [Hymenobacter taeanensis]UOQ82961.1 glycosyltransferase [Hymenobacter sp. 5414T-23]
MENKEPSVSVIIPNYNHARHLPQRIESVINQDYKDIEVIILDDCSPDNSRDIIDAYAATDVRIRVEYNTQNSGSTFKQWNKGVSLARGKYIWIAESDDYADPTFLSTLLKPLEEDVKVGIAFCTSWEVDENNNLHRDNQAFYADINPDFWSKDFIISGIEIVKSYLVYRNIIPNASAVVLRKQVLLSIPPADETMKVIGDWLYWVQVLAECKLAFVAKPLNYFRQHTNNVRSGAVTNGQGLKEEAHLLGLMQQYTPLNTSFYELRINSFIARWFYGLINYNISSGYNKYIYKELKRTQPNFTKYLVKAGLLFLFSNKMSGIRQIIGDGILKERK